MKILKYIFLLFISVVIFSCGPKKNMIYMDKDVNYEAEITQAKFEGSKIQQGDVLDIKVTGYDELAIKPFNLSTISQINDASSKSSGGADLSYTVDKNGEINFPVLGKIYVIGLNKDQLKENLENRLKKYLIEPIVLVKQLNMKVTFLGEFGTKGMLPLNVDKLNILNAIALGGGTNENADLKNIRLIRNIEGVDQTFTLDVTDHNIVNSPYYYIQNNDILYALPNKNAQIIANKNAYLTKGIAALGFLLTIYTLFFRK